MKYYYLLFFALLMAACAPQKEKYDVQGNPFFAGLNEPIDFSAVKAEHLDAYANITVQEIKDELKAIKNTREATFDNVFRPFDELSNNLQKAANNCFMLYWVSPDSLTRARGFAAYELLDSLTNTITTDKQVFEKMKAVKNAEGYKYLNLHSRRLVDDQIRNFEHQGVDLSKENQAVYQQLNQELSKLKSTYSNNMNAASDTLRLDEAGAAGLPENFKKTYQKGDHQYAIPVIKATRGPVMSNARAEATRKAYYFYYYNRAADQNLVVLDSLVAKRYELAKLMGYKSFAAYNLTQKMAKDPSTVWNFVNDLVDRANGKARKDLAKLRSLKAADASASDKTLHPWDISYYKDQILKKEYNVDKEALRAYLPMQACLKGMMDIYQHLLGLRFVKVENPAVWHPEVEMYEVYDGDSLQGRFYLDLFPRPNKESWFYGVELSPGRATPNGYEVPVSMLLGNFTRPTEELPSLLSFGELNTLFHEFGHIVDAMSYRGEFALQSGSKSDFVESMSQIFENWIWDYDVVSTFAKHYETGEVLPKATFENLVKAKNLSSGYGAIRSLRLCMYDLNLYDKFDPANPFDTDQLWKDIDKTLGLGPLYVAGTHPQASWIHINTHPVYFYGYLWSKVYAQDMFTAFEKNGLQNQATGIRYRKLILGNGLQRDIVVAVENFLGRPSNNKAYIRSLGLD